MDVIKTRDKDIKLKLSDVKNKIFDFAEYLGLQKAKVFELNKVSLPERLDEVLNYVSFLGRVVEQAFLKDYYFGREVLLFEIDSMFRNCIDLFKQKFERGLKKGIAQASSVILELEVELKKISFIIIEQGSYHLAYEFHSVDISSVLSNRSYEILGEYLGVGETLKNDKVTKRFLKQIKNLHRKADPISMYSAIIGPSFMGKTQVAFTLSCLINVVYVNFIPIISQHETKKSQSIYMLFEGISRIFKRAIDRDDLDLKEGNSDKTAAKVLVSTISFRTLGLIYLLLKTRKIREAQCVDIQMFSVEDWLIEIANINSAIIPLMTIRQFLEKTQDIDFGKQLFFIDELPRNHDNISSVIAFLRNLCRVIRLPTFLSGTDSRVGNMTGRPGTIFESRVDPNQIKPWVNINVKTSKASLISFSKLVKFKKRKGEKETKKTQRLDAFVSKRDLGKVRYKKLLKAVYGSEASDTQRKCFKKLARFLVRQAKTSLPGIIPLMFSNLLELLPIHSDVKQLWKALNERTTLDISQRKETLAKSAGLLASSHILSFPSFDEDDADEDTYSATLVETHLFYYGTPEDKTFSLDLRTDPNPLTSSKIVLTREGSIYKDKCYFPELTDDFFSTFACLNMWNVAVIENEKKEGLRNLTMADLYENYIRDGNNFQIKVPKTMQNSFSLELLTFWSICCASHQDLNGRIGGVDLFWEFVKNLQKSRDSRGNVRPIKFSNPTHLNENLKAILDRIEVPYLMRFPGKDQDSRVKSKHLLDKYIGDFISMGEASFPRDKFGWDVAFDMNFDGIPKTGLIECKFRAGTTSYAGFFEYYKKQCESNEYPLAFLVCRKLGQEISEIDAETVLAAKRAKLDVTNVEAIASIVGKSAKVPKRKVAGKSNEAVPETDPKDAKNAKINYIELLNVMWTRPENHIDIYTVKYDQIDRNTFLDGKFTISPLMTFPNPRGAFILVQSNFSPPALTEFT